MSIWGNAVLSDVAEVFNGKTPSKTEQRNEGHPVLKIRDVSELGKFRGKHESFVDVSFADKYLAKQVQDGDTLILNAAHNADYVASKTYRAEPEVVGTLATGEWLIIRPSVGKLDAGFAHHWVTSKSTKSAIRDLVNGIHLYPKDIARLKISLPSMAEQRRIAAILDQADALRAKRREALAQLDTLTQSIFIEMFGDPAANPMKWPEVQLKNITMSLRNGLSPSNSGGVFAYVLTLSAITGNQFDSNALKKSTFNSTPPPHQSVNEHDFLICRGNGNLRLVGKGYFPPSSMEDVTFPDTMIAARIDLKSIGREYLQHLWHTDAVRRQIEASARTTNGTFKVNQTMLEELTFMLPPLPRQSFFSTRIQSVEALKVTYRAALQELDRLFASSNTVPSLENSE